jgi:DNA mismatch repair protein MutS
VAEYIHERLRARTLFATHYHELTDLALTLDRVTNCNVAIKEWNDQVIFLRRVVEGGADKSYGIQVARLAGLPSVVVDRAKEVLANLEQKEFDESGVPVAAHSEHGAVGGTRRGPEGGTRAAPDGPGTGPGDAGRAHQLGLFADRNAAIVQEIASLDLDALTPLEAMNRLADLKKKVEGK